MAIKVTGYSCEFKCGRNIVKSKKTMIDHESRCFHNPEKKACITCAHFEKEQDGNGMDGTPYNQEWVNLLCHAGVNNPESEEFIFTSNCQSHKPK